MIIAGAASADAGISAELRLSPQEIHQKMPVGFGGGLDFPLIGENTRWGIDAGVQVITSWEDSLELLPEDTAQYDIWTKNGTDIFIALGPAVSHRFSKGEIGAIPSLGAGTFFAITAYDETKKSENPPPLEAVSDSETETDFYIRPALKLYYKKLYLEYEYIGLPEAIDHVISAGIMF